MYELITLYMTFFMCYYSHWVSLCEFRHHCPTWRRFKREHSKHKNKDVLNLFDGYNAL